MGMVGEDEGEDVSVAVEDVVDEAGFGFRVFNVAVTDVVC